MYLVFTTSENLLVPEAKKTKVSRSYSSKESILKDFLKSHITGEIITDTAKLKAYQNQFTAGELLAVNRCAGHCATLELLHIDKVSEI